MVIKNQAINKRNKTVSLKTDILEQTMANCDNFDDFIKNGYEELLDYLEEANGVSRDMMYRDDVIKEAKELWDEFQNKNLPF